MPGFADSLGDVATRLPRSHLVPLYDIEPPSPIFACHLIPQRQRGITEDTSPRASAQRYEFHVSTGDLVDGSAVELVAADRVRVTSQLLQGATDIYELISVPERLPTPEGLVGFRMECTPVDALYPSVGVLTTQGGTVIDGGASMPVALWQPGPTARLTDRSLAYDILGYAPYSFAPLIEEINVRLRLDGERYQVVAGSVKRQRTIPHVQFGLQLSKPNG